MERDELQASETRVKVWLLVVGLVTAVVLGIAARRSTGPVGPQDFADSHKQGSEEHREREDAARTVLESQSSMPRVLPFSLSSSSWLSPSSAHASTGAPLQLERDGSQLSLLHCSACHGPDGRTSGPVGIRPPALNDPDTLAATAGQ